MAGTIFGLGLSQRVDPNGQPDGGWKLYLYQAASDTPVIAYKDTGLTAGLEHPWPILADAYGMMPAFWLADGSYRARGISSDGSRLFFDMQDVLALGASSGSGGGGASVDPSAVFQTGDTLWLPIAGTRSGWVRDNGRTIGSSTSGATERANADCQNLFTYLWTNFGNELCPVPGGRGANAAADWAANKQITLLDMRGRMPCGLDDMGNSAASRFVGVPFSTDSATTPGAIGGESLHTLTNSESAQINVSISDTRAWGVDVSVPGGAADSGVNVEPGASGTPAANRVQPVPVTSGSISASTDAGGQAHNNMPPFVLGTFYRKL